MVITMVLPKNELPDVLSLRSIIYTMPSHKIFCLLYEQNFFKIQYFCTTESSKLGFSPFFTILNVIVLEAEKMFFINSKRFVIIRQHTLRRYALLWGYCNAWVHFWRDEHQ